MKPCGKLEVFVIGHMILSETMIFSQATCFKVKTVIKHKKCKQS